MRGLKATCSLNVVDLYATRGSGWISPKDQEALWENIATISVITGPTQSVLPRLLIFVHKGESLCASGDGAEKFPLFIIGKSHKPHRLIGKTGQELGFDYSSNSKAWMT